jgi:diguanylate cyclase (GGDEF)-like protein
MPEPQLLPPRPPLNSLATKIILFVFLSTFATALVVSWISIRSTHAHLRNSLDRRYPAALARAAGQLDRWLESRGATAEEFTELERTELTSLLAEERPDPHSWLLLTDGEGRVLAGSRDEAQPPIERVPLAALLEDDKPGIREYTNAQKLHVVGAAHPLAQQGWYATVETHFDQAFAPVLAVVSRVFAVDLCIILLFSYLAYRITTRMVRPIETLSNAARNIAQGDFDHEIPEPSTHDEIGLLARTFNDMMRRLRGYQSEIETANRSLTERNVELQQAKETFQQLSITDGLTKLHNHRFFQDHLTREIKRVTRSGEPLSMLMADIDDFKSLNDRLGHAAGDELLAGLAGVMNEMVRDSDLLARYGGEEFVVLAPNTDLAGAYKLAEKIRISIADTSFILDDSMRPLGVTISIGVAQYEGDRKTFFQATDRALYRAKAEGKNCVVTDAEETLP